MNLPLEYQVLPQLGSQNSFDSPGCLAIVKALSIWIFPFLARRIGIFLEPYLSSRNPPVTDLRAIVIPSLKHDGQPWPTVQWQECDTRHMAIFTIDPSLGILSCLFHSISSQEKNALQWHRPYIAWYLTAMDHLFDMLEIVQHVLGLSLWQDDIVGQLFDPRQQICTNEE